MGNSIEEESKEMWRETFLKESQKQLSLEYLQDGNIQVGDYIYTSLIGYEPTSTDPKKDKPLFLTDKLYKILEIPEEGRTPIGVIVNSEKGKWFLDFREGYIDYFKHKQLSTDDRLGMLDVIPFKIMELLNKFKEAPRTHIISTIMQDNYSRDAGKMQNLKEDITESIYLLLQSHKIEQGSRPGFYKLTIEGMREMNLTPDKQTPTE